MWAIVLFALILMVVFVFQKSKKTRFNQSIKTLTRQCARWLLASTQDQSPMVALLHCQYGMGYLWAIGDICTDSEFSKITGKDWKQFVKRATEVQDEVTMRVATTCPEFAGDIDKYLLSIGK